MLTEKEAPQVYIHTADFLPYSALASNQNLVGLVKRTKADGMEWIPLGPITSWLPVGPTHDVLHRPNDQLKIIFKKMGLRGHAIFNPFASLNGIIFRQIDPLRLDRTFSPYQSLLPKADPAEKALQRLEAVTENQFPVVVYPNWRGINIWGDYKTPLYQTHPYLFNDPRGAGQLAKDLKPLYAGICFDLYHAQEPTASGLYPFGKTERELFQSLQTFKDKGVLEEVHVQPGRIIDRKSGIEVEEDLADMLGDNPNYDTFTGRALKFLIHELDFKGPFTIEVNPRALAKTCNNKSLLLSPSFSRLPETLASIVDYIRRA
jgi:hypothetical protein